jgi:undecaprenyl-diphosphatase
VGATVASEAIRSLAERRRVAALALWTIPLGLATIAYAHALPLPS